MTTTSCPAPEQLREFALGRGDAARFDTIEQHVETCPACQEQLEKLDTSTAIPGLRYFA